MTLIKTSLEFAPDTSEATKDVMKSIPPYDLLVAYRRAALEFGNSDIVLIIAVHDEDVLSFEARTRTDYVNQAFNAAAKVAHPMAKETAHRRMRMPVDSAAFWLVLELRDKDAVLTCAVGEVQYRQDETVVD